MEEFKEKELKMKEEHYRRMEDKQMVFDYHHAKEKNKKIKEAHSQREINKKL